MYKNVFVDQCGYLPRMKKHVTIRSKNPVPFRVLKTDGTVALVGVADKKIKNKSANETDYIGDFSHVTQDGCYYIVADGFGESDPFLIGKDAYADVFQKSMAFFYYQRCGQKLPESAAGAYAHEACHTGIGHVYGSDETKDVTGGWHDAGDYGRYVGPGAMSVAQLLYAYERAEALCASYRSPDADTSAPIRAASLSSGTAAADPHATAQTETGALPAYLTEIRYELDWMMKMQREDGAVYHKATCKSFCPFIMPQDETGEIVISPVSVTATGDLAAVCALAVRFYETYDKAYAKKLEEVSRKAYDAMKTLSLPGGFKNPPDIRTGEYGDTCDTDERYWAAAELYKAFGDDTYRQDFETLAKEKIYQGYGWADMGSYGNLAYLSADRPKNGKLEKKIRKTMTACADKLMKTTATDGYGVSLTEKQYIWGSNLSVANNGLHLYDAYILTGKKHYLHAAAAQLHYLLGRNSLGLCFVTGCGSDAIKHPHHRPSCFVGKALPGMLSGGPCSWFADELMRTLFTKKTAPAPAKCLLDMSGSYSTNEVTIYWNSAFLMLLATVIANG